MSLDYSQVELRIAASIAADEKMLQAFEEGADIHRMTAATVFAVDPDNVTDEMRFRAKALNFGILYGMGINTLALNLNISRKEAQIFYDAYFSNFPKVQDWIKKTTKFAEENGYVETLFGRKRFLPHISSPHFALKREAERMAINMPVQGTAADIIKMAMIKIDKLLDDKKYQNPDLKNAAEAVKQPSAKDEKEMQKVREKLEDLKKFITNKYKK